MSLNMKIAIDELVYQKIMHWVHKAGGYEVSGLGNVVYDKEAGCMRVTEAYLLEQENTGSTTDIDANAIGKLEHEHYVSGIEGELKFWWHSHANMGVFWSKTDMDTIEMLGNGGWFACTVFNAKEEMRSCFFMTDPVKCFTDELTTVITSKITDEMLTDALNSIGLKPRRGKTNDIRWLMDLDVSHQAVEAWDAEYESKVTEKKYVYSGNSYPSYGGPYGGAVTSAVLPITGSKKESFPDFDPKKKSASGSAVGNSASSECDSDDDEGSFAVGQGRFEDLDPEEIQEYLEEIKETREDILRIFQYYPFISREDLIEQCETCTADINMIINMMEKNGDITFT